MKLSDGLQKFVSFGYLFLVVLGILKESIFYYQLGINILNYSSITDILISPIADISSQPALLIAVLFLFGLCYAYPAFLAKNSDKKWAQKFSGIKNIEEMSKEDIEKKFTDTFVAMAVCALLSFFVGTGLGQGAKVAEKIKNDKLTYNHTLTYTSGNSELVYLISSNSVYHFYVAKGKNNIKIAPISVVKHIEITENTRLK